MVEHIRLKSSRRRSQSGNSILEITLILLPILALAFAIFDFSMPIFLKSMFESAVREGCRFGITYQMTWNGTTYSTQTAAIQAVVKSYALGLPSTSNINVKYYSPTSPYSQLTGTGANSPGNILEVSIGTTVSSTYNWTPVAPLWRDSSALAIKAVSADRLEGLPAGTSPPSP